MRHIVIFLALASSSVAAERYYLQRPQQPVYFADGLVVTKQNVYLQTRVPITHFDRPSTARPFHLVRHPKSGELYWSNRE